MDNVEITVDFINKIQEEFVYCTKRNQNFNGSFGNGKSFGASIKATILLATFPYYRIGISRYSAKELTQSTMSTFFKVCPPELYNEAYGGRRNDRDGYLRLINGSEVLWMHLDDFSDVDLRGKEFNSVITDQGEEISEEIYNILDARMERWDMTQIPPYLNPESFPKNKFTGKPMPPCYNMLLFNPETTLHWIYRRCHPDSDQIIEYNGLLERSDIYGEWSKAIYYRDAAWFTASMHDNPAIPDSLKAAYLKRDQAWIDRFYWGKWGVAGGNIHYVSDQSILDFSKRETRFAAQKLLEIIKKDGTKYRVMDHGEGAPTCCLWFAYLSPSVLYRNFNIKSKGIHICYREYYQPGKIIKYHREMIHDLSQGEKYQGNFADPQIFKKTTQKYGGFWTVADDYLDYIGYTIEERAKAPSISWQPADNNEMSCRDAVNELLQLDESTYNPITGLFNAPALYFLKRHAVEYPYGCSASIAQLQAAKRKKVDNINGEDIYSDARDENVTDHAYDPVRYYAIMPKVQNLPEVPKDHPQFSFNRHLSKIRLNRFRGYHA
jgi:hypothetical protein